MKVLEQLSDGDRQPSGGFWDFSDVSIALIAHAARTPKKTAIIDPFKDQCITYESLLSKVQQAASTLGCYASPGAPVGLTTTPGIDALVAYLAVSFAGAAPVMIPTPESPVQTGAFAAAADPWCEAVDCSVMLEATDYDLSSVSERHHWYGNRSPLKLTKLMANSLDVSIAPPKPSSSTTGHWIFSSGTTGPAKAIRLSRKAVAFNLAYTATSWGFDSSSCIVGNGMPFHSAGLMVGYLMPIFVGGTTVLLPPAEFRQNPSATLKLIAEHGVTHLACADSMIATLLREAKTNFAATNLSRFRHIIIGGEPLVEDTLRDLGSILKDNCAGHVTIGTAFGMTEAAGLISSTGLRPPRAAHVSVEALTVGRAETVDHGRFFASGGEARFGVSVYVIDDNGAELDSDRVGRVVFRSPSMFDSYEGQDTKFLTITRKTGELLPGTFPTGDLGFVTQGENGPEIVIIGREKETIFIGTREYFSLDIETMVAESSVGLSVDDVIAVSDPEVPDGILVLIEGLASEKQQAQRIRDVLAQAFTEPVFRVALIARGSFCWIPTSSKKPRLRTRSAVEAKTLPVLAVAGPQH